MAATVSVYEANTGSETKTDSVSNLNFGSTDATGLTPATYPISFSNPGTFYSYEKYFGLFVGGTFTKVDNLQWWMATSPSSGVSLYSSNTANTVYATPVMTVSSKATNACPTADPGGASSGNIGIGGSFSGAFTSSTGGYSNYVCAQLRINGASAAPGNMTQLTFSFQYDEQ
jgi:hypothetical protein